MPYDFVSRFAQKLIEESAMVSLPAEYLEDYQSKLEAQIIRRMGIIALENLNEAGLKEYDALLVEAKGDILKLDQEKVAALWEKYIPNFQELMQKGMEQFAKEYKEGMKQGS